MLKQILRLMFRLVFRVEVRGNVASVHGHRTLVVANHQSFLDGVVLGLFLPVDAVFVVHTSVLKNFWFRQVLRLVDHLAVDPSSPMAIKQTVKLVSSGRPVVIFPEGRITVTGSLMKVYSGPSFVAARTGARIVPVRIDGLLQSYFSRAPGCYKRMLFPKVTLTIMAPTVIPMPSDRRGRDRREKAGKAMRRLMQAMMCEARAGQTVFSAFLEAMALSGRKREILEDKDEKPYRYLDLLKSALALGRVVARHTEADDAVGVLLPNVAMTASLFLGLNAFGRVPAMLNYTAGRDGLDHACRAADIRLIVTSRTFLAHAGAAALTEALQGREVLYLEDIRSHLLIRDKLWLAFFALRFPQWLRYPRDDTHPAALLFTSGSEGKPKGVVLSHRALLSNIAQIRAVIDFSPQDKFFNALPVFHAFGLTGGLLLPLLTGTRLLLYPSPLHNRIIPNVIYDRNCTVLFGTSTFLGNYAKFAENYDFRSLRYVIAGAEKLNEEVRRTWMERFGLRILEGYGATETAPVLAVNTPMAYRQGSVGQLLPGIEAFVEPVAGIEQGGRLHVRGPNLMSGYLRSETPGVIDPTRSAAQGPGWYDTGDIVEFDEDGFLFIKGRAKRFAKIAGEMISLERVERLAETAYPDAMHAAVAVPDPLRGETIVLFTTAAGANREVLQRAGREQGVADIAIPKKIEYVAQIPLLGTGKVDYVGLYQKAAAVQLQERSHGFVVAE